MSSAYFTQRNMENQAAYITMTIDDGTWEDETDRLRLSLGEECLMSGFSPDSTP